MRKILLALLISAIVRLGMAAESDSLWSRLYGGATTEQQATKVIQTSDGNYLVAGWNFTGFTTYYDMVLVKTDTSGDTLWMKAYSGLGSEQVYSVIETDDGGFLLAGYTRLSNDEAYMVKTDSLGNVLWTRIYGGWAEPSNERFNSVVQTPDGGYLLAGTTGYGYPKMWLVRTDAFGDSLWNRRYGGTYEAVASKLVATSDGGFALAGWTNSFGAGARDGWLLKVNAFGDSLWSVTYGGSNTEYIYDAVQTSDDGFLLTGMTQSFGAGLTDAWAVKTDEFGAVEFNCAFGGLYHDESHSAIQTSDGNYLLAGKSASYTGGAVDAWIVKFDAIGDTLWTQNFGGSRDDAVNSIIQLDNDGYLLAGSYATEAPLTDFIWLLRLQGTATGVTPVNRAFQPIGVALHPSYPNPFNSATIIGYELPTASQIKLEVFDISGKLVATLVNGRQSAGSHNVTFDASGLASGIYLCQMTASGSGTTPTTFTRNLVYLK